MVDAAYLVSRRMSSFVSAIKVREGGEGRRSSVSFSRLRFITFNNQLKLEVVKLLTFVLRIISKLFLPFCFAAILLICKTIRRKGTEESQRKYKHSWPLAILSKKGRELERQAEKDRAHLN